MHESSPHSEKINCVVEPGYKRHTDSSDKQFGTQKTGQGNVTITATTRGCWEERGLRAMVGLSLSEPEGPQGKSHSRERGTLTDSQEIFPQSNTQTELQGPVKRTLVKQGAGGREGKRRKI